MGGLTERNRWRQSGPCCGRPASQRARDSHSHHDPAVKRFGADVIVVNDLSLQIADGEFLVLIGFRPEHLDIVDDHVDAVRIPAGVDPVEYLGNEELIHPQAEGKETVALIPSDRKVRAGDQIELGVPLDKLRVFDPKTEQALVG